MKIRTMKYFTREGFINIWTNRLMSAASIGTVIACLIIFGLFIIFSSNLNYIVEQIEQQWEIKVFLDEKLSEMQIRDIGDRIKKTEYVRSCILETKEEALENYKRQLGEEAYILDGFDEYNPLRYSYIINIEHVENAAQVEQQLKEMTGIVKINNHKEFVDQILKVANFIHIASFWIMLFLAGVAVFIISNTIKLAVFARRKEINIMKFVGATDWFIRWPFVIEGMLIGLFGAIVALGIIGYGYIYLFNSLTNSFDIFELKQYEEIIRNMAIVFVSFGTCMGIFGSLISVRKYLRV